jgi:hypothetical protein
MKLPNLIINNKLNSGPIVVNMSLKRIRIIFRIFYIFVKIYILKYINICDVR